ncbi:FAD-dependent monooxygenase [Aldersonia sp. NBC_00410]|uniref:FAD-dependent monooxygenase n=1 Tax=Aldersonia sp. NBC_00410 TaxID=2975954 RepID=UPI0022540A2A|nr:FAD-dependent monooxygenase [Aldersonia sp. NBC_00410]MCX5044419.1 FAD-dependent monooxygenase [Aldersonia sp. NBC_00410]
MGNTDVLIAGAGPIGLTAAIELRRRGVRCRVVDPLLESPQYAKAVGVQPRTLELFEGMGVLRRILDAAIQMRGQLVYVNGTEVGRIDLSLPPDVPYQFIGIPQYATERILRERLYELGVVIERGMRLASFVQDDESVVATLAGNFEETVRAKYVVGCDGAHSTVRKTLGLTFEGAAFEEEYMLGDVEVDWTQPRGYSVRSMHQSDGVTDDLLVCIPLPGRNRYRVSMLVPEELASTPAGATDEVVHGFEGARKPELRHIQAVLDRLSPEPTRAANLRWSSVFRISHRIVNAYGRGRVFVAGDAAHIHPPTGAQGMNTGIQDAHNLAWKLALAVHGEAAPGLLASYDAERRPVGEEVVGRTVRSAREGIGADSTDVGYVMRREAQLLIDYAGSPIIGATGGAVVDDPAPRAGMRAPDARGLTRDAVSFPLRLFDLFDRVNHTMLIHAGVATTAQDLTEIERVAAAAAGIAHGRLETYVLAEEGAEVGGTVLPLIRDSAGEFARMYSATGIATFVVRPDGYLGFAQRSLTVVNLHDYLKRTFR